MKKINKILITALVLTGMSIIPANAGEDQATYAVVDSNGVVTNTIVCGPAVCGPSGSWGGIMPSDTPWAGQKLVLQVPVHTVTGQSLGGYLGTPENPVRYDSQAQVFTQGSVSAPVSVTRSETLDAVDTTTLTATIYSDVITFGPNNVIDNKMQFTPVVTSTTSAVISASEGLQKETALFDTPKTKTQLQKAVENKLVLIQRYLNRFYIMLNGWLIE